MRELLEDAAQLVDGALHVLQRGRAAGHVRVLAHHHLLVLPPRQQRLPAAQAWVYMLYNSHSP